MSVFLLFWLMADAHHVIDLLNHITCIKTFRARLIYREISLLTCFDFIDLFYNLFLIISFTKGSGTFFFFFLRRWSFQAQSVVFTVKFSFNHFFGLTNSLSQLICKGAKKINK